MSLAHLVASLSRTNGQGQRIPRLHPAVCELERWFPAFRPGRALGPTPLGSWFSGLQTRTGPTSGSLDPNFSASMPSFTEGTPWDKYTRRHTHTALTGVLFLWRALTNTRMFILSFGLGFAGLCVFVYLLHITDTNDQTSEN